jgi:DNA-directed RNA polymerase subunit RPC12/RpoP
MVIQHPIICGKCNKDTGLIQENFTQMVIMSDIKCPHCGTIVIKANGGIIF